MREKCTPHKNPNFPHHLTIFIIGRPNHVPSTILYLVYLEKSQLYILGKSQKINSRKEKNSKTNNNHKVCTYLAATEEVQKR